MTSKPSFIFSFLILLHGALSSAEESSVKANDVVSSSQISYHSNEDDLLTIKKVSVLPMLDNVKGIYSRPLEDHLIDIVKKQHNWDYSPINLSGPLVTPEEMEENSQVVSQVSNGLDAEAILATRLTKGPSGIAMKLDLFLTKDGRLLAQTEVSNYNRFELTELKAKMTDLFSELKKKIPYQGMILSRQGELVTVNLGKADGMEEGRILSVIQVIKLNRHPKFNFLISTEKEVLGKIKLVKIDETLSFGKVIIEKEKGVIVKNAKLFGADNVVYAGGDTLADTGSTQEHLLDRPDGKVAFGKNAFAWLPEKPPTFGVATAGFGDSLYNYSMEQSGGVSASSFINPWVTLGLELWLTPTFTLHANLKQGIVSFKNPKSGYTPSSLSASMGYYEFLTGYKFRLSGSIWGPQVELMAGLANYNLQIDSSSAPISAGANAPKGLTSTQYSGLKFGLSGSYPFDNDEEWSLGTNLFFFLNPRVSENPSASGTHPKSAINQFGFFVSRKLAMNLKAQANLEFELFKTSYAATSDTTSSSQKLTSLNLLLQYLF